MATKRTVVKKTTAKPKTLKKTSAHAPAKAVKKKPTNAPAAPPASGADSSAAPLVTPKKPPRPCVPPAGKVIRAARIRSSISLEDSARRYGVDNTRMEAIEKSNNLTLDTIEDVMWQLGWAFHHGEMRFKEKVGKSRSKIAYGDIIRTERINAGITQVQLARMCKVGQNRMSAIELSNSHNWDTLSRFLRKCGTKFNTKTLAFERQRAS
jgi:transcriptional regulator with XRE-family HTH domain